MAQAGAEKAGADKAGQTAEALRALAAEYLAQVEMEEAKLDVKLKSFKVRLGDALVTQTAKGVKLKDIVASWAPKKGAEINRMDWRKSLRKVVDEPDVKKIDALFSEFDADGGGSLDQEELLAGVKLLRDESEAQLLFDEQVRERASWLRVRMQMVHEVADRTAEAEDTDTRLKELTSNKKLSARLGAVLLAKNMKIGDLINSWDATEGDVSQAQFRKNVRGLVVDATAEEMDELFSSIDLDGGGTLDLDELKEALGTLREASVESDKELKNLRKATAALWKVAKASQLEFKKQRKADEAEAKAKVEEEAKAKEAAEVAAAEVRAAKKAVREAAERAKDEEKQKYAAKIQERRASLANPSMAAACRAAAMVAHVGTD